MPASDTTEAAEVLWRRVRGEGLAGLRTQMIEHYLPFARSVATRVYRRSTADGIAFDDYLQWARVGLVESIDRFDSRRGIVFEAYAVHRIRGAILNGLASATELLAQRAAWHDRVQSRVESLTEDEGGAQSPFTLQGIADIVAALAFGFLIVGDPPDWDDSRGGGSPYQAAETEQIRERIHRLLPALPERERQIVRLHYFDGYEFQEIAAAWGLSKGRISQLHSQALRRLRLLYADATAGYDRSL